MDMLDKLGDLGKHIAALDSGSGDAAAIMWGVAEIKRLRAALREIAHSESGSRGAYQKFYRATRVAQQALDGIREQPVGKQHPCQMCGYHHPERTACPTDASEQS